VVRQAGQFERKGDAVAHTAAVVAQRNRGGAADPSVPTVGAFLEDCSRQFPRHPRTRATNAERIRGYILPFLPSGGNTRLDEIRRAIARVRLLQSGGVGCTRFYRVGSTTSERTATRGKGTRGTVAGVERGEPV
jgi:hypothetical protein